MTSTEPVTQPIAAVEATKFGFAPGDTITHRELRQDGSFVDSLADGTVYVEDEEGVGYFA